MINIASRAYNRPEHGANVSAHAQEHSLTDTYYQSYKTRKTIYIYIYIDRYIDR